MGFWLQSSGMWHCDVSQLGTSVSDETAVSIFRVENIYPEDGRGRFFQNVDIYLPVTWYDTPEGYSLNANSIYCKV
jgi:hypothetical protein